VSLDQTTVPTHLPFPEQRQQSTEAKKNDFLTHKSPEKTLILRASFSG